MTTHDPLEEDDNSTPLTDGERQGLRLPVLTRSELNRAEADDISQEHRLALLLPTTFAVGNGDERDLASAATSPDV